MEFSTSGNTCSETFKKQYSSNIVSSRRKLYVLKTQDEIDEHN